MAATKRLALLEKNARTDRTSAKHAATMKAFRRFLASKLDCTDIRRADPVDVVAWLMDKDLDARTVVHTCKPELGSSVQGCLCRTRVKSNTLSVTIGTLRAAFNEAGIMGEYDAIRKLGNPCASAVVKKYLRAMGKEQVDAGVKVVQAPAFAIEVYDQLIAGLVNEAADARRNGRMSDVYVAIRDALLFALAFNSLDRCSDLVSLEWHDLETFAGPGGVPVLHVRHGLAKTSQPDQMPRASSMAGIGAITPRELWDAWLAVTADDRLPYGARKGYIFRTMTKMADVSAHMATTVAQTSLREAIARLHLANEGITMHSFRASGAIAAVDAGLSKDSVMAQGNWAGQAMFEYYTNMRTVISLSDAKSARLHR